MSIMRCSSHNLKQCPKSCLPARGQNLYLEHPSRSATCGTRCCLRATAASFLLAAASRDTFNLPRAACLCACCVFLKVNQVKDTDGERTCNLKQGSPPPFSSQIECVGRVRLVSVCLQALRCHYKVASASTTFLMCDFASLNGNLKF